MIIFQFISDQEDEQSNDSIENDEDTGFVVYIYGLLNFFHI